MLNSVDTNTQVKALGGERKESQALDSMASLSMYAPSAPEVDSHAESTGEIKVLAKTGLGVVRETAREGIPDNLEDVDDGE